jgi:signal transduction histidine kinase
LYIVSEILKAHQAKITIADNAPKGTVFRMVF